MEPGAAVFGAGDVVYLGGVVGAVGEVDLAGVVVSSEYAGSESWGPVVPGFSHGTGWGLLSAGR